MSCNHCVGVNIWSLKDRSLQHVIAIKERGSLSLYHSNLKKKDYDINKIKFKMIVFAHVEIDKRKNDWLSRLLRRDAFWTNMMKACQQWCMNQVYGLAFWNSLIPVIISINGLICLQRPWLWGYNFLYIVKKEMTSRVDFQTITCITYVFHKCITLKCLLYLLSDCYKPGFVGNCELQE